MLIAMTSQYSGIVRAKEIPITEEQFERWKAGELIQVVAPELSEDDREFLISGMTAEEWEEFMDKEVADFDGPHA